MGESQRKNPVLAMVETGHPVEEVLLLRSDNHIP
jgi:hypothetical protein